MAERKAIAKKRYVSIIDGAEVESSHASPETVGLNFNFANGQTVSVNLSEIGEGCQIAATFHGLAQKIGDTYNKAETVDDAIDSCMAMLERLAGNEWVKPGEGPGPRVNLLVDAIVAAIEADGGEVNDERKAAIRAKVSEADGRKGALANPAIASQYEAIRARRAAEKAKEAAAKAKASETDLSAF